MAFCTQCGRKLEEGQICICQRNFAQNINSQQRTVNQNINSQQRTMNQNITSQQRAVNQNINTQQGMYNQNINSQQGAYNQNINSQQQAYNQSRTNPVSINIDTEKLNNIKNESKQFANNIFGIFLQILKRPVEAGRRFILSQNMIAAFAFIVLQGIFSGLVGIICVGKINSIMQLLAGVSNQSEFELAKFSLLRVFIVTLIGSVIISLVIALITWGIVMIFKGKAAFSNMLCAVGVRCVGMIPATIVAALMLFISIKFAIIIFIIGALVGIIFMGCAFISGTLARTNHMPYILLITVILSLVVHSFTVSKLMPMYFSDTIRVAYKQGVREMKNSLSDFDFDDILENIMESYY